MQFTLKLGSSFPPFFYQAFQKIQSAGLIGVLSIILLCSPAAHSQTSSGVNLTPFISLLLFDSCPVISAATTVTGNQNISTQTDLDALKGITRIDGDLRFVGTPSTLDFKALDTLVEVTGNISFSSTALTAVSGFDCLSSVSGNLTFSQNIDLTSVSGFSSLTSIGGSIFLGRNSALTTVTRFPTLSSIGGSLTFDSNTSLTGLSGFSALKTISENLSIGKNVNLIRISGFSALTAINGEILIDDNSALTDLPGFSALTRIGGLFIGDNDVLVSISGFSALTSIDGRFVFVRHPALTGITGFLALTSIGGGTSISFNNVLTNLPGFSALTSIGGVLSISSNNALTSLPGFSALKAIGGDILVNGNSMFDCTNPVPPFVPVTQSTNNMVNCDLVEHTASSSPSLSIPDNNATGISDTITITGEPGTIDQLTIDLDISHTYVFDLTVTLSNGTTTIELLKKPRQSGGTLCSSNDIAVNLSDTPASLPDINSSCAAGDNAQAFQADSYKPLQALSGFMDSTVNGTWTLKVTDTAPGDSGTLNSWGLNFTKNRL